MQNSDDRPRFTLFAPEDAEAMTLRERTSSTATLPPPAPTPSTSHAHLPTTANAAAIKYFEQRASSYTMRPSQTFYGGRDSIGNDTDASIVSSSIADGSGGSSGGANSFQQQQSQQASAAVTASNVSASTSAASRARLSVCQDVSNTFEDMFETDWEGYIWKQGHVVRSWRYRYAVLSGTTLTYYVSKDVALVDTEKFRGRVTVTGARRDETRAYGVQITTTIHKVFCLYTRSTTESELWIQMIQRAVAVANGHKPSLSSASVTTTRTSDPPAARTSSAQLTPTVSATAAILAQSVRSSLDWKTRNLNTLKQFYALWSAQLLAPRGLNESPAHLLALFPLCATDMLVNVRFPPNEFLPPATASLYGREGLVDVALSLSKFVQFRRLSVTRFLNTKHPHVLHVVATGKLWNRALQREFAFTTRDELQLSPGGRVLSLTLVIDVDAAAFTLSDADRKSVKADRAFHATTTKRVLSLSIQHFHVNRVLGKGTFGTVVLAERKNTREVFAVKILEKSSMSNYDKLRTKTEMRILRDVHHPFIAPLRFSFQSHSRVFLGMEYYPGGSLYTHMNRFSANKEHRIKIAIDLQRVKFYAAQIVLALCHLHACDIVYRDLKPDNIMIDEDGNIALVDFGLSKTSVSQLSGARTMAGSPAYTAPELLKPKRSRDYGKAVDWWCLGILIYEMLLAKRPFHHLNVSVLYKLIEKDPVKFPPKCNIPAEARSLIAGLLEKDPTKRLGARQTSDLLTHPFFRDVKWDLVLRKRIEPPWIPPPVSLEDEKLKNPDINYDKYLASKTSSTNNFFSMFFSWRSQHARAVAAAARRKPERDNDTFGKFSYVSDTTNSFLVDEDEMLDAAFTGRRSIQLQTLSADA